MMTMIMQAEIIKHFMIGLYGIFFLYTLENILIIINVILYEREAH